MKKLTLILIIVSIVLSACNKVAPPEPFGAVPSERQLNWHKMKYYAFIHFSPNTFTDMEWGFGDEDEAIFNPTELDCRQWARVAKEAGMEGIVITAKHHDGFCLWPTETTEHSIKNSPYKNGKGDIIQELREACDEYGINLGIYLSPWDRNHHLYGTPEYINVYRQQLTELLTNYGKIYEFWMDGAMGGSGYYGGANETRKIDNKVYYDWPNTHRIVRELQPMAIMFSDGGPDCRWVGNERGYAYDPVWSTVNKGAFYPGIGGVNQQLNDGHEDGDQWLPAEVNTSIRPGWFYHKNQDDQVKSLNQLIDNWYHSVGMNGNFILNIPPDQRGLFHENDVARLLELREYLDKAFSVNLAKRAKVVASDSRSSSRQFGPKKAVDSKDESYWATDDGVKRASLEIDLGSEKEVNCVLIQEYIKLGQRVKGFGIEVLKDGEFEVVGEGITVGNRRLVKFKTTTTSKIRIKLNGKSSLAISNIEVYRVPEMIATPQISRNSEGQIVIKSDSPDPVYHYTLDGSEPSPESPVYQGPIDHLKPVKFKAKSFVDRYSASSETVEVDFGIPKTKWRVRTGLQSSWPTNPGHAVDDNPSTFWLSRESAHKFPDKFKLDLGQPELIRGLSYLPRQDGSNDSNIYNISVSLSPDNQRWETIVSGHEFSNIRNNPVMQYLDFGKEVEVQYIEITVHANASGSDYFNIAELGVISE